MAVRRRHRLAQPRRHRRERLPAATSSGGFRGIALRNATTGQFVLSASKTSDGNTWQQVGFSAAQLAALPQDHVYTLDFIDAAHGSWGWVNMDSVTIPGSQVAPPNPYLDWAATKGLSGPAAAFDADPDGDGIANGIEFVLGGQPNPALADANSQHLLPTGALDGDHFVFTYRRSHAAAYLGPLVEFASDLSGPWIAALTATQRHHQNVHLKSRRNESFHDMTGRGIPDSLNHIAGLFPPALHARSPPLTWRRPGSTTRTT
jgi:hypothetical protein